MKNKRILSLVLAFAMLLGTFSFAFADNVIVPNNDLVQSVKDHEYQNAFAKLNALGIAEGDANGSVRLDDTLTRAEAAKMVLHMLGLQEGIVNYGPSGNQFKDVTNKHWASQYIAVAADHGVVTGHTDGTFRPEDPVTEDQIVAMIVRALDWGPIVGGNYPYGEYAKALELKIIEKAPIYNKVATRGYAFQVAANSLKAQMAERKATEDRLTYEGEGYRNLLNDRLHVYNTSQPVVVVKTARMERDFVEGEFEVNDYVYNERAREYQLVPVRFVGEGYDATEVLGDFVEVWYKYNERTRENEVVYLEVDENYNKVEGIVETVDKDRELKIENGRTYNIRSVDVYRDNIKNAQIKEGDYVSITVDRSNNVRFVDAFDLTVNDNTDTLDVVTKVLKAEDDRFEFENQDKLKRTISDEKLIVYKNGKIAKVEDIEELDLIKAIPMTGQARTTFVLVVGETVEGEVEKVKLDTRRDKREVIVTIDGEEILADETNFMIVDGEVYEKADDLAEALKGYVKKEVTLVTVAGKAKVLVGEVAARSFNVGLTLNAGLDGRYSDDGYLKLLNGANENTEVKFTENPSKEVYTFNEISHRWLDKNNNLSKYDKVTHETGKFTLFYGSRSFVDVAGNLRDMKADYELGKGSKFEGFDKGTMKVAGKYYNIEDSTVFYTLNEKQTAYTAVSYEDIKDKKASEGMLVELVLHGDTDKYATPTVDVVVVTKGYFDIELETVYGVLVATARVKDEDDEVYTVYTILNEDNEEVDYISKDDTLYRESGLAVKFELTGDEVKGYKEVKIKKDTDTRGTLKDITSNRYHIGDTTFEVAKDGLVRYGFNRYNSNKHYEVSYVTENDKLKAISLLKEVDKKDDEEVATDGTVTYIDDSSAANLIVEVNGDEYTAEDMTTVVKNFLFDFKAMLDGQGISFNIEDGVLKGVTAIELGEKTFNVNSAVEIVRSANLKGLTIVGQGADKTVVDFGNNDFKVSADNVTIKDVNIKVGTEDVIINGDNFTSRNNVFDGDVVVNGENADFNTEINGTLTITDGASATLTNVKATNVDVQTGAEAIIAGETEVTATLTVNGTATIKDTAKAAAFAGTGTIDATDAEDEDVIAEAERREEAAKGEKEAALEEAETKVATAETKFETLEKAKGAAELLPEEESLRDKYKNAIEPASQAYTAADTAVKAAKAKGADVAELEDTLAEIKALLDEVKTAPELEDATLELVDGKLVLTVEATDSDLFELEIDNSIESTLPQFSVYAIEGEQELEHNGKVAATVVYEDGTWTITFSETSTTTIKEAAGEEITFYFVVKDLAGNQWGDMYNVTEDMTFEFTIPADEN